MAKGKNKERVVVKAPQTFERHFFYHGEDNLHEHTRERELCHWCQIASFATHSTYPITITNDVDNFPLPADFRFISDSVLDADVFPADADFKSGCDCVSTRDCQFSTCHCLQDVVFAEDHDIKRETAHSYYCQGDNEGCLTDRMLRWEARDSIYECHGGCACADSCSNRVVERGRKVPLNVFKTEKTGYGVKSEVTIKKGQFIDRYIGQIITAAEANRRRQASDIAQRKDIYLFALDKFSDPESRDARLAGPAYEVDGEFMSGPTRFINHSCKPNCRIFARVGDHADKHLHDLAFFALEDVEPGTELTFDYVDGDDNGTAVDETRKKDMTKCLCGEDCCRGYLW